MRGRDIKRYGYDWAGLWLINTHNGVKGKYPRIDINDYPAIKAHLDSFGTKVTNRADQGDTPYNLRNCAYLDDFNKPKIVYPETTVGRSEFFYDENAFLLDKTCFFISGENLKYLEGILTSKVIEWYLERECRLLGKRSIQYSKQWMDNIPIPQKENQQMVELVNKRLTTNDSRIDKQIDALVYKMYGLTEEEIKMVEAEK